MTCWLHGPFPHAFHDNPKHRGGISSATRIVGVERLGLYIIEKRISSEVGETIVVGQEVLWIYLFSGEEILFVIGMKSPPGATYPIALLLASSCIELDGFGLENVVVFFGEGKQFLLGAVAAQLCILAEKIIVVIKCNVFGTIGNHRVCKPLGTATESGEWGFGSGCPTNDECMCHILEEKYTTKADEEQKALETTDKEETQEMRETVAVFSVGIFAWGEQSPDKHNDDCKIGK